MAANKSTTPTLLPRLDKSPRKKEQAMLSASLLVKENKPSEQFAEKTIYRSQNQKQNALSARSCVNLDEMTSRLSSGAVTNRNNNLALTARGALAKNPLPDSLKKELAKKGDHVDWASLGDKIEDWFIDHEAPEQKIVYKFLKDLRSEGRPDSSAFSDSSELSEKAQNLEDILSNLRKYRSKAKKLKQLKSKYDLPNNCANGGSGEIQHCQCCRNCIDKDLYRDLYDKSSFRTMRHLKSSDIRNKYPLPKANPDYHFRNSTVFLTAGRPPKSTFLIHPDWV